jgi:hypothetical protein
LISYQLADWAASVTRRLAKTKTMLAAVAILATMTLGTIPAAFAQEAAGEISVTGVVSYQGTKADGCWT